MQNWGGFQQRAACCKTIMLLVHHLLAAVSAHALTFELPNSRTDVRQHAFTGSLLFMWERELSPALTDLQMCQRFQLALPLNKRLTL